MSIKIRGYFCPSRTESTYWVYLLLLYIRTAVLCQQQSEGRVCRQHLFEPTAVQQRGDLLSRILMMYTVQQAMLPQQAAAFNSAFFPFDRRASGCFAFSSCCTKASVICCGRTKRTAQSGMLGGQRKALLHRVGNFH